MDFLPKNYEAPVSEGNYFKFKKGDNKFRILSPAIMGFEYWTKANKPVRQREAWEEVPEDAKIDSKTGLFQKYFLAFIVYNYEAKKVQIMEITQKTVREAIEDYANDPDWGDPSTYDLVVKATGDGMEREYKVASKPHSKAPETAPYKINLEALFESKDPFSTEVSEKDFPNQ